MGNGTSNQCFPALTEEEHRIRQVYAERKEPGGGPFDLYSLYLLQELQEALVISFREMGLTSLKDAKLLDVGCGSGGMLWRLHAFGANSKNCFGIDLLGEKLRGARRVSPQIGFVEGNAAQLPFPDGTFDLVFQFLLFTSVLDSNVRRAIASEIMRTVRPGGHFVWYDFLYSNPRNSNVRGVRRREIEELFSGFRLRFRRITLAPPIGRIAARLSPMLCRIFATLPVLRTHYLCIIQKPA